MWRVSGAYMTLWHKTSLTIHCLSLANTPYFCFIPHMLHTIDFHARYNVPRGFALLLQALQSWTVENSFMLTDDGKWMCRLCCVMLRSKAICKSHLQAVHLKEKKYPCCFCQKRFGYSSHARSHERKCPQRPTTDAAFWPLSVSCVVHVLRLHVINNTLRTE